MQTVGRWLGVGIAGLVNVFDPRVVVLGGLFGRMAPMVLPTRARELAARALSVDPRASRAWSRRAWAIDAPVLGAAERAFEPLLADPLRRAPGQDIPTWRAAMANV